MLIGDAGPELMPVPQSMTLIQSPTPMMQVSPAIYQPVPYAPASLIPAGSSTPLEFLPVDVPQLLVSQNQPQQQMARETVIPSTSNNQQAPVSIKFSGGGNQPVSFEMTQQPQRPQGFPQMVIASPQAAVPYVVSGRSGGMVAMAGLNDDGPLFNAANLGGFAMAGLILWFLSRPKK